MKAVCIPCSGSVEVEGLLPVLDHPLFQRLRRCRQLGLNDLVFPGARHSRLEHALGVLHRARLAAQVQGMPPEDRRALEVFALLHDVGHGPFSHQVEPVLPGDHHQRGAQVIREMEGAIRQCGADPARLLAMLAGKDPLGEWVSDRNLGADKLDYLERDALHLGFVGTPPLDLLQKNTLRSSGGMLALREKFIEEGKRVQKFYSYLHQHGYLNKTALTAQRMLQWALQHKLQEENPAPETVEAIWRMADEELVAWLLQDSCPKARKMTRRLLERDLHQTCLCIKPTGYAYVENVTGKDIALVEWPREKLQRLSQALASLPQAKHIEEKLAQAANLPQEDLLLAAMPYFQKLLPRDLRIANGGKQDYWLLEKDLDHRASLESDYLRTFAIRIAVPKRDRKTLAKDPAPLLRLLDSLAAPGGC